MRTGRRLRAALAAATLVVSMLLTWIGIARGDLDFLTWQLIDVQFPTGPVDERILVVEIPLEALGDSGASAPDRDLHVRLIAALADAAVVAYDMVFDRRLPGDDALRSAIAEAGNVVLGADAYLCDPDSRGSLGCVESVAGVERIVSATRPDAFLAAAARGVGHTNVFIDPLDGIVRRVPLVFEGQDQAIVPSLSLAAVAVALGVDPDAPTLRPGRDLQVADRRILTGARRDLEVNWAWKWQPVGSSRASRELGVVQASAADVLAGRIDVRGRIVFVGVASHLLDWKETPTNKEGAPGVHVHAQAANTMLTNLYRSGPQSSTTMLGALLMILGVVGAGMVRRLSWVPLVALVELVAWHGFVNVQAQYGVNVDPLLPTLGVLAAAAGITGARYVTEEVRRRRVVGLFRQYVPDAVADGLLASDRLEAAAAGERVEVTVLFCDLRGFTRIAADLEPRLVRQMLEVYYDHLTRIIFEHGGTVMQFVGDEVFAVFGAPGLQADHAQRALDCSLAMQGVNGRINADLEEAGVRLAYGIGLNSGPVVAAHVGSQVHRQYAVVGNTVNVGARLCSLALPGGVVLSTATRDRLERVPELEALPSVPLKGVQEDPRPHRVLLGDQAAVSLPGRTLGA